MTIYRFSALRDGQSVNFRRADLLNFDQTSISAADVRVGASGSHTRVEVGSKDVLLLNTTPYQLGTSFANGSRLLAGSEGGNSLVGTSGRDHLLGFGGDDTLNGGAGADRLDGGLGNDTYVVTAGDVIVDAGGTDHVMSAAGWTLAAGLENLTLTGSAAATAVGNSLHNVIVGNAGNNQISGRDGDDTLYGGGGSDTFNMSLGTGSSYGNDFIDGGAGIDTIDFGANARSSVHISLSSGTASGGGYAGAGSATLVSIENAVGGAYTDYIGGNAGANFLYGGAGDDWLAGGDGNDRLEGGPGDDYLYGGTGTDLLLGGDGNDTLDGVDGNHRREGGAGNDYYVGSAGVIVDSSGIDTVATAQSFTLPDGIENLELLYQSATHGTGNALANRISGGTADNWIDGRAGNDTLIGDYGHDTLVGGDGDDWLEGGLPYAAGTYWFVGNDVLTGGAGRDSFIFRDETYPNAHAQNVDRVTDFTTGVDKLRFDAILRSSLGSSGNFSAGDERFYAARGATEAHDASDRLIYDTSSGRLYYDWDGAGGVGAYLVATLDGAPALAATDIAIL